MRYCHCVILCNDFCRCSDKRSLTLVSYGFCRCRISSYLILLSTRCCRAAALKIPRKAGTNSVTNIHTRLDSLHALRLFVSLLLFAQTHAFARRQVLEHHRFRLLTQLVQSLRLAPEDAERFKTHVNSTCTVHRKELTWLCGYFRIHS